MSDQSQGTTYTSKSGQRYVMRDARLEDFDRIYEIWKEGMEQHGYVLDPANGRKRWERNAGLRLDHILAG